MFKYAIIGCGRISANHLESIKELSNELTLVAVCDTIPENMSCALDKSGIGSGVAMYTDYKELLENQRPDIVAIATDSGSHAKIGLDCLEFCHVIIEKPMALGIADASSLIATAKKYGRVLAICHQNRFNKSVQKIRQALDEGRFGKLSHIAAHVRWNRGRQYYEQAPWRGKWATDGGCLMNQCIHNADLLRWFMGDIDEVFAYTSNIQHTFIEAEDLGLALIKGRDGTLGLFEGTVNVFPKNLEETLYIFGEKGTAKAAGTSVNLIEEWKFADGLDDPVAVKAQCVESPPNVYGFGHLPFYQDVIEAIKNETAPAICGQEGKAALELILAMYKSKKTGLPVSLPLDDFASVDMEGVFCNL